MLFFENVFSAKNFRSFRQKNQQCLNTGKTNVEVCFFEEKCAHLLQLDVYQIGKAQNMPAIWYLFPLSESGGLPRRCNSKMCSPGSTCKRCEGRISTQEVVFNCVVCGESMHKEQNCVGISKKSFMDCWRKARTF